MQQRRQQQQQQLRSSLVHNNNNSIDDESTSKLGKRKKSAQSQWGRNSVCIWTGCLILLLVMFVLYTATTQTTTQRHPYEYLTLLSSLRIVTLFPIYLCCYTFLRHIIIIIIQRRHQQQQQPQPQTHVVAVQQVLLPVTVIITVVAAQLPSYIGAAIASMSIIAFSIVTRPSVVDIEAADTADTTTTATTSNNHHNTNHQHPTKSTVTFVTVVISLCIMIGVLLVENFLIWVVSATFVPGYKNSTAPLPLQDNGQHILNYIFHTLLQIPNNNKSTIVSLRRLLNTQWSLVGCVGTSFVITEIYNPRGRTLYGIANRALLTIATARFIRTISFMITVVPSQNTNCYIERGFPFPPPQQWLDWIWIGIIPRSHGGCNDLIISGHATIISTLACLSTSVSDDPIFAIALWSMVVMDFMIEIYEGFHYSVDMWLGIVLVSLLWSALQSVEGLPPASLLSSNDEASLVRNQKQQEKLSIRSYVAYIMPGLVAYMQLMLIPQEIANIIIVLYVISAIFVYIQYASKEKVNSYLRQWYIHYAQHILLCLVFLALGIYL